ESFLCLPFLSLQEIVAGTHGFHLEHERCEQRAAHRPLRVAEPHRLNLFRRPSLLWRGAHFALQERCQSRTGRADFRCPLTLLEARFCALVGNSQELPTWQVHNLRLAHSALPNSTGFGDTPADQLENPVRRVRTSPIRNRLARRLRDDVSLEGSQRT